MNTSDIKTFVSLLRVLDEAGALRHTAIIGSWAELLYSLSGALPGFEFSPATRDIDVLVRNLRLPSEPIALTSIARERGIAVQSDRMTSSTRFIMPGGYEVEFLIAKRGAGREASLKTNVGVTADSLRHLDILTSNLMQVDYLGMAVNVPTPEAYALQKLVINEERAGQRTPKALKDAAAVAELWPYLDTGRLVETASHLTRKEAARMRTALETYGLDLSAREVPRLTWAKVNGSGEIGICGEATGEPILPEESEQDIDGYSL